MADLTVTAAQVGLFDPEKSQTVEAIAAEAVTAGQPVYINSSGKAAVADASLAGTAQVRGIALQSAAANQAVTLVKRGDLEGYDLSAVAYDTLVTLSDTAGALDNGAGSPTVTVPVGRVKAVTDSPTISKLLAVDVDWLTAWS